MSGSQGLSQTFFMSALLNGCYKASLALPDNQLTKFKTCVLRVSLESQNERCNEMEINVAGRKREGRGGQGGVWKRDKESRR